MNLRKSNLSKTTKANLSTSKNVSLTLDDNVLVIRNNKIYLAVPDNTSSCDNCEVDENICDPEWRGCFDCDNDEQEMVLKDVTDLVTITGV